MIKKDIIIIGGGPAGIVAAVTARKNHPNKTIVLIREKKISVIPCGIPYIFNRLDSVEKNILPDKSLEANKIEIFIKKVNKIDTKNKCIYLNKKKIEYEKLILATGSKNINLPIKGTYKKGVYTIEKDYEYLKKLRQAVLKNKNIFIIGGGFIGIELAEELSALKNKNINIIERADYCLHSTFDKEFAGLAQKQIKDNGVNVYTNKIVKEIGGKSKVEYIELEDGKKMPADLVILSIGAKPNIDLVKQSDIKIEDGGIKVDEYMRTNIEDVFAIGDCTTTKDFFTQNNIPVMLASTATSEARIAASNLYKLKMLRKNKGTLGSFCTSLNGVCFGVAGYCECAAKKHGFEVVIGEAEAPNHHPGYLPGSAMIKVKLIFSKDTQTLLGGHVMGPDSSAEIINIISLAVQNNITASELETWQFSTHPLLTSAPTVYPLVAAAQDALMKKE